MSSRDGSVETFPWKVEEIAQVPPEWLGAINNPEELPYMVFCPGSTTRVNYTTPRFIAFDQVNLTILELTKTGPQSRIFPWEHIQAWETGTELLISWVAFYYDQEWHQLVSQDRVSMEYNSVGQSLFHPFLTAFLNTHPSIHKIPDQKEARRTLESLIKIDYRYYAYPNDAFRERALQSLFYHPETRLKGESGLERLWFKLWKPHLASYVIAIADGFFVSFSRTPWDQPGVTASDAMIIRWVPRYEQVKLHLGSFQRGFALITVRTSTQTLFQLPLHEDQLEVFNQWKTGFFAR
ncbi:MAG: hypothetical protein HKM05_05610 [Spirochaetales bacterium]|nr:hypothetical protein [Spirochaetales bacterium]